MKRQRHERAWLRFTWLWLLIALGCILSSCVVQDALGATYVKFTYPSGDGTSGRFIVFNEANGDSVDGEVLTETDRGAMTYWAGSTTVAIGSYIVEGFVFEGSDTSAGSYRLDIYPGAINDTVNAILDTLQLQDDWIAHQSTSDSIADTSAATYAKAKSNLDSLQSQDGWVSHQTTSDSLYDSLLIVLDSLEALESWIAHQSTVDSIIDSLQAYDGWMAHQTTVDSLWDSLLALQDTVEAALGDDAMGDKVWLDASSRTLSAYRWTVVEKDSALAALTDAAIGDKVWTDAATRSVTESVTVDVSDAMTTNGLISKIEDTVHALAADYKATGYSTHNAADVWTSGTRALTSYIWSTAEKDSVISSLADAVLAEKLWEYDSSNVSSSGGMGLMLKDTSAYQGSASGLTASEVADSVWNRDTSDHSTAASYGVIIKDTGAYQGGAAGMTAGEVADSVWNRDTSDQSTAASYGVILKDTTAYQGGASGLTAAEVADSVWTEDTTGHFDVGTYGYEATGGGGGSDTTAILAMLLNNLFCRVATDTPIVLWNDGKVKLSDTDHAAIEDSVHENAADYKASGYSSHSAADIWTIAGGDSVLNAIEDANKDNFKADVSALSTHSVLDVYNQFIAGANEEEFWLPKSVVADTTWLKFNDGSNEDNFKADITALTGVTDSILDSLKSQDGWVAHQTTIDSVYDSLLIVMDSLEALESWVAQQTDLTKTLDSLAKIIDSLENQDNWIAHQSTIDSVHDSLGVLYDSQLVVLDSLEALESWIAKEASLFDPSTTVVTPTDTNESGDTLARLKDSTIFQGAAASASSIADAVWDEDTATHNSAGSYGIFLKDTSAYQTDISALALQAEVENLDGWNPITISESLVVAMAPLANRPAIGDTIQREAALATELAKALDSLGKIIDSLEAYDGWIAHQSTVDSIHDTAAVGYSTAKSVLDSLQAQDGWIAHQSTVDSIHDSLDVLYDSLLVILDSLEALESWIAQEASLFDPAATPVVAIDTNASGDTLARLKDSTAFQGPASGLTLDAIADTVWAQVTKTVTGGTVTTVTNDVNVADADMGGIADSVWTLDTGQVSGATEFGSMLKDTGAYQGAAAGITADEVSDSVWSKAQAAYTTVGTFGYNLDVPVSSVSGVSGSGAYAFYVVLIDSGAVADSVIPQAKVYINNYAQSATPYWAITDNNGRAHFQLDAANWVRFTLEPGFAQNLDSFTVSATATETLYVYRDAGSRTTVAFELNKPNGDPYSLAKININLVSENDSLLRIGDTIVVSHANYEIFAEANSEGLASINLEPNSNFSNDSTYYRCIIRDEHNRVIVDRFKCRVPDTSAVMRYQNLTRWE